MLNYRNLMKVNNSGFVYALTDDFGNQLAIKRQGLRQIIFASNDFMIKWGK